MPPPDSDDGVAVAEVPSLEEQASRAAPRPVADLEHPWLGLESFREETRAYFFGRDAETAELHLRLRSQPLLVLYGRSGFGKTSILSAGLIPRLRRDGHRAAIHRLSYGQEDPNPFDQLLFHLGVRDANRSLPFPLPNDAASRLWLHIHRKLAWSGVTHLILDQFEEVFTVETQRPGTVEEVREALGILVQGAVPASVANCLAGEETFFDYFDPDSQPVRVILALRDDYVYALNRWRRHLPQLGQNYFELRALRGPAAFDAVFKPGCLRAHKREENGTLVDADTGLPPIVSEATARRIVRFIAEKKEDVPLEGIEAVPPILSLLCRELNERRYPQPPGAFGPPLAEIVFDEQKTNVETILETFYERCLAGRPEAVRIFIEEDLVSRSGIRLQNDEQSIVDVFANGVGPHAVGYGAGGAATACLRELVNERLLSPVSGGETPRYELTHDLLCRVVYKSRTAREERIEKEREVKAKEDAERRAEQEKRAKEGAEAREKAERELRREQEARAAEAEKAQRFQAERAKEAEDFARAQKEAASKLRRRAVVMAMIACVAVTALILLTLIALRWRESELARTAANAHRLAAESSAKQANEMREQAEGLINFMLLYLRDKLEPIGRLDLLDDVAKKAKKYLDTLPKELVTAARLEQQTGMLENLGDVRVAQGKLQEALDAYQQGLAIAKRLAEEDKSNAGWQRDLSVSYNKVGGVLEVQGKLQDAMDAYQQSLNIRRTLADQDKSNAGWQRDLSVSYERVGNVLEAQGKLQDALDAYQQSLNIRRTLADQDKSNAGWQRDLSVSDEKVGGVLEAQGKLQDALDAYQQGLAISKRLADQDKSNAGWQQDLSVSYEYVGGVLEAQGKPQDALDAYQQSLNIRRTLADQDKSNSGWQRDLSASYDKVGGVLEAQGKLQDALDAYQQSLNVRRRLADQDKSNSGWQRDLSVSYNKVGGVLVAQGKLQDALDAYQQGLAIAKRLTEQDKSNSGWQRDLSVSYERVGNVLVAQGKLQDGLDAYQQGLAIAKRLTEQDKSNVGWQRDLIVSLYKVGTIMAKIGGNSNVTQAADLLRTGLNLAELYSGPDRQKLIDVLNLALRNLVH
jgi:tetratricopeptide (TPR) repeat protein